MKKYYVMALAAAAIAVISAQAAADGRGHRGRDDYSRYRDHGGRGRGSNFSLHLSGPGWWGPSYYDPAYYGPRYYGPSPYYYAPRTVIIQPDPPVYIQRAPDVVVQQVPPVALAPPVVWYYCPSPAGYYPTVQNCEQPWVNVDPRTVSPAPPQ